MIPYPPIRPISAALVLPRYRTKRFRMMDGSVCTRLYGSRGTLVVLTLQHLLKTVQVAEIMAAYNAANGSTQVLALPQEALCAMTPEEQAQIPNFLEWHFGGLPRRGWANTPGWATLAVVLHANLSMRSRTITPGDPGFPIPIEAAHRIALQGGKKNWILAEDGGYLLTEI